MIIYQRTIVILSLIYSVNGLFEAPPTGDRLEVAVGLTGSEDPADSVF